MAIDSLIQLRSAQAKMPWDWGFGVDYNLTSTQANIQAALNTFASLEPPSPTVVLGCPKYGTFKYGTRQYCSPVGLRYYRTVFRDANLNWMVDWNLQSPDGTIWTPSVDTIGGTLTFTPGTGSPTVVPVMLKVGEDDTVFVPSMANDGTLTLTPDVWSLNYFAAAIYDSVGVSWVIHVAENGNHLIGTDIPASQLRPMDYLSLDVKYTANQAGKASATNYFAISKVVVNAAPQRDTEGRFYADVEFVHHKSISLDVKFSGSYFSLGHVAARVKRLKKIPRG